LRVDAKEFAVKVGKKLERRIRPNELVRLLADAQKRPLRFRESQFFELLYRAWRRGTERRLCRGCGAAPPSRVGANAIAGGTAEAQNATVAARDRPRERGLRLNNLAVPASRSRFFAIVSPNFPPAKNRAMRRWRRRRRSKSASGWPANPCGNMSNPGHLMPRRTSDPDDCSNRYHAGNARSAVRPQPTSQFAIGPGALQRTVARSRSTIPRTPRSRMRPKAGVATPKPDPRGIFTERMKG